ncbi:MAG: hypothetical protein H6721_16260 [Sandaracinus sp.]|nr:hypothetical protein [Sandaracinus sp.]MCB9614379.1 hypothetical protein [Sandaracinus sp.]MCB9633672.1 hypothetical protein [Sandaracinus sp.]
MIWRVLESVHGHLGVLAAAALLHPAILLRRGLPLSRGGRWSVGLTAFVTAAAFGLGVGIYEAYRDQVKRPLFRFDREVGLLFETKEHLAWAVVCLALGGAAAAFLAGPRDRRTRQLAALAFALASVLCLIVVVLGTWVASTRGFPEPS